eukprot:1549156-Pyramimonas_sp.AAC.1
MDYEPCERHRRCGGWLRRDRVESEPWVKCHRTLEGRRCSGRFVVRTYEPAQPVHPPPSSALPSPECSGALFQPKLKP